MSSARRTSIVIAVAGTITVTLYAVWAAVQILVLNPLAAAPGRTLGQIHADLDAAGESLGATMMTVVLGIGVGIAVVVLVVVARRPAPDPFGVAIVYLVLIVLGAPGYFTASFSAGMSLADTYGISGGDHSPWALPLYVASVVAFAGIVTVAVTSRGRVPAHA